VYDGEIEPDDIVAASGQKETKSIRGDISMVEECQEEGTP